MEAAMTSQDITKVVVVSRDARPELIDTLLDYADSDVVFLASPAGAYSQIKRVAPDLVVMCFPIDDREGFHLMSMLHLDAATAAIPVIAHALQGSPGMTMN
jgi:CheY-like chemotaxis protein